MTVGVLALLGCEGTKGRFDVYNPHASAGADDDDDDESGDDDATSGIVTGGPLDDDGPGPDSSPIDDGPDPDTGGGPGPQTSGPADDGPANVCGDNTIGGDEVCDGSDTGANNCKTEGFDGGDLGCAADCGSVDTSGCVDFECGNGVTEGDEACDGDDLAGEDCLSLGYDGGELTCKPDCSQLDPHFCITAQCGDAMIEGLEICDGSQLGGETCASQGFIGGDLSCTGTCTAFDASACTCDDLDAGGDLGAAIASGDTDSDDDTLSISCAMGGGADHIVSFTAPSAGQYVFETVDSDYDTALAAFDTCDVTSELACNDDAAGQQSQITLNLDAGQTILLVVDGWNGDTGPWVLNVNAGTDSCVESTVDVMGSPAAAGNTVQQDEDIGQSCASGGAADHLLRFVAPQTGTYTIDTFGSSYDTALAAYTSCDPDSELVCNDDAGGGQQSQISLGMMAGQEVLLAISGFAGQTGNWELNISLN